MVSQPPVSNGFRKSPRSATEIRLAKRDGTEWKARRLRAARSRRASRRPVPPPAVDRNRNLKANTLEGPERAAIPLEQAVHPPAKATGRATGLRRNLRMAKVAKVVEIRDRVPS